MAWIILSVCAAAFQTLRFMLQKTLSMGALSAGGATYARFFYSAPFIATMTIAYLWQSAAPVTGLGGLFFAYALGGGLFQILGTWAMVALFSRRNFAVGITFKKTEVMQTALIGFVILGDRITVIAAAAILLGLVGVFILSAQPGTTGNRLKNLINPVAGLGVLAGAMFSISAVGYRGATLQIVTDDAFLRAIVTLVVVTLSQTIAVTIWLRIFEPGQITKVAKVWRKAVWMGLTGLGGSICWFTAFALQNAAYVFAVGQIEVIFSIAASILFFGERLMRRELVGIALLSCSIIALVLAT
ncbi:MAG: DMT family transporter [Rhodobacteraceae bacterium]|nr:DMT family transporter [Paracoccaceae bacterium]